MKADLNSLSLDLRKSILKSHHLYNSVQRESSKYRKAEELLNENANWTG